MKAQELREKSLTELEQTLMELRQEQFNLRMQQGTGQLNRPSQVAQVRKDIARVKTIMNEQQAGKAS
jgi:large subunit ribosomal protein L29